MLTQKHRDKKTTSVLHSLSPTGLRRPSAASEMKVQQSSFTIARILKVWMGLYASDDCENDPSSAATSRCPCNPFFKARRWSHAPASSSLSVRPPASAALLADQQVRICLSGIFPTGSGWDELWCDTLPSVLLGSQGDQDKSPRRPTGDALRSCLGCFWGPDQDAEDFGHNLILYCPSSEACVQKRGPVELSQKMG